MIDIVTMRYGTKYGPEYLQRWAAGVKRNLTLPYRLVCMTDDPHVYDPDVHVILTEDLGGWWNHLWAFSGWTANRQLLIDLDDVIVGSLDDLASYDGPHALNSDVYQPENVDGGCQLIPAVAAFDLYFQFVKNRHAYRRCFYSDKQYYQSRINHAPRIQDLFPGHWVSYKVHCREGLPEGARVVGCHGTPKPHEIMDDWMLDHWRTEEPCRVK